MTPKMVNKQVESVAKQIIDKFGVPEIIINSAGAGRWRYLWEMPVEEIRECVNGIHIPTFQPNLNLPPTPYPPSSIFWVKVNSLLYINNHHYK
jgi:hypothetical protein